MKLYQGLAAAFLLSIAGIKGVNGQTNSLNVTTTAVPFLQISPDARAGAMGDLGVGTTPDASSTWYNLAKTTFNTKDIGAGLTYTPWLQDLGLQDVYLLAASGYYKFAPDQALSTSLRYFSLGNIQFTDYQRECSSAAGIRGRWHSTWDIHVSWGTSLLLV